MCLILILAAIALLALSGVPGLFMNRESPSGQRLAVLLMAAAGVAGLCGVGIGLDPEADIQINAPWFLPWGRFTVAMDAVSAVFLLPVFVLPALGAVYGLSYWKQAVHPRNGRKLRLFFGLLAAAMAMVVISRNAILFLIAWEIMAVAAYFLATTDDEDPAARRSGWVYLIATHVGTVFLLVMFAMWRKSTGTFTLYQAMAYGVPPAAASAIFLLAVIGFGFKAGLMPLHVWLPGAHANAPSHVSAVMSGVMLKMGVYGIVRFAELLPATQPWWGGLLLTLGAVSAALGIAFAIGQRDLKRLLAYSSIENVGVIAMGVGLAVLGRALHQADWMALGLGGALFHVWNHGLFKSLLFLNSGAIIHAARTRDIERLGGLGKAMPRSLVLFIVGAASICALPPLNGFTGELFIYLGLFRTLGIGGGDAWPQAAFVAPLLAMTGALAVACFVKLLGAVFLGQPRSGAAHDAHDPDTRMTAPMFALAGGCVIIGLFPGLAAPLLDRAISDWSPAYPPAVPLEHFVSLEWVTFAGLALTALIALSAFEMWGARRQAPAASTWGCGYAQPSPRMQYTGSSFAQTLVEMFSWALWPKIRPPRIAGLFAQPASFKTRQPDTLLDRLVAPAFAGVQHTLPWLRQLLRNRIQVDIFYIFLIALALLLGG